MDTSTLVARAISRSEPELSRAQLTAFVERFLERRDEFLATAATHGSPLYLFDPAALRSRAREFVAAFRACRHDVEAFYALKSNSYPAAARLLVEEGLHLDVSSGAELECALTTGARQIVFSGPGKTDDELHLAAGNTERVTVLADSINELHRLEAIAVAAGTSIRTGIRLTTDDHGIWRKFGIPLSRLPLVFETAASFERVLLCGLQFHISWNLNPEKQMSFIRRLGATLAEMPQQYRRTIDFIDCGGGFWPSDGEWMQWPATTKGAIHTALGESCREPLAHFARPSAPIHQFAADIVASLLRRLPTDMQYTLYTEPGRWLCHESMHMLLTVIDRKAEDVVITDGGTNAIGWDRFELDYFPVINLTRPSIAEHPCLVAGSLCTPHDLWGYSYFGSDIQAGDILLVPNQGAYTWSLRQEFIKPLPPVVHLDEPTDATATVTGDTAYSLEEI